MDVCISVIVPTYNVEKYIEECLYTIIKQTLDNIEIICIDDGSEDETLDIIEQYAKKDNRINISFQIFSDKHIKELHMPETKH